MKKFIVEHITSPGFQNRAKNLYWPVVKMLLAKPYNATLNKWNEKWYLEQAIASDYTEADTGEMVDGAIYTAQPVVLKQQEAFEEVKKYLVGHEPQKFGMCVTHSIKNIYRFAARKIFGGQVDFSEHDIYIDRTTRAKELDGGMNASTALDRIAGKGIAIAGVVPDPIKESDLKTTREQYPDVLVQPFRLKLLKGHKVINAEKNFDKVWAYITETYYKQGVRPFQMSISSLKGWWSSDVPTGSGTPLGGHSAVGLTIPFMYGKKRAFFCVDSSYRPGQVWQVAPGVRIVTEDCWNGLGRAIRPITYIDAIEAKLGGSVGENAVVGKTPLEKVQVASVYGQANEYVARLQKALIAFGYDIPAISTGGTPAGHYGQQTADAVAIWYKNFDSNPINGMSFPSNFVALMDAKIDAYNAGN